MSRTYIFLAKLAGGLLIFSSMVLLLASFFIYRHSKHFVETASRAQGTVIRLEKSGKSYFPVYTFQDARGNQHEIHSYSGSNPPSYSVGDKIPILYQPDNPQKAEIDSFTDKCLLPLILAGGSAFDLLFALLIFLVLIFLRRRAASRLPSNPSPQAS